ncbi:MAG: 50S ribosomal protein L10 [Patescibacteria group bacterium]|nr:50S ribosomal protein L10 [Patescibacteria group bacterium]
MPKTREQKEAEVREIVEGLGEAKSVVLADLSPLKVSESTELRHKAAEEDVKIRAVKKTLFHMACEEAKVDYDEAALDGSIMLLMGKGDEIAPARLVAGLRKTHKELGIHGGLLESKWMSSAEVVALAKLPSKDQLIAQVVGSVRAPLSGLVGVLQGNLRGFVYALNAMKDSKS